MGHDVSATCPKCNIKEETLNHHVGECTYYQSLRMKVVSIEKITIKSVVEKLNINLLAKYLQQIGRVAEYMVRRNLNKCESGESCNGPKLWSTQCASEN